jgi:hypothetical protein
MLLIAGLWSSDRALDYPGMFLKACGASAQRQVLRQHSRHIPMRGCAGISEQRTASGFIRLAEKPWRNSTGMPHEFRDPFNCPDTRALVFVISMIS